MTKRDDIELFKSTQKILEDREEAQKGEPSGTEVIVRLFIVGGLLAGSILFVQWLAG